MMQTPTDSRAAAESREQIENEVAAIGRLACVPSLLKVICETTGMGFAAIARVSDETWTACAVRDTAAFGLLPGQQLEIQTTLCREVRANRSLVAIDHVAEDPVYRGHHTPRTYGFQSYISVPIVLPGGRYFGNLCALDAKPAEVSLERVVTMFTLFADMIAQQLDTELRNSDAEAALLEAKAVSELREQFIAVLGHDLRNPLAAIATTAQLLQRLLADPKLVELAGRIGKNSERMKGLIDQLMDFARGRLGGGIRMELALESDLATALIEVGREIADANPSRAVVIDVNPVKSALCNRQRLQQLVSNLLGNALAYGDPAQPITLTAGTVGETLLISVHNFGKPIPREVQGRIFAPFWRNAPDSNSGLGLGLHIATEIVRAHRGRISVTSTEAEGTAFVVEVPIRSHDDLPAETPIRRENRAGPE